MSEAPITDEEIRWLRSIRSGISVEEWRVLKSLAGGVVRAMRGNGGDSGDGPAVAEDRDLDSRFGDPMVRKDPKRWAGDSYVNAHYSQCPTDYLLVMAEGLEYFASRDKAKPEAEQPKHKNGTPFWQYNLKDAARARGWARRNQGKTFDPPSSRVDTSDEYDQSTGTNDGGDAEESWAP